MAENNKKNQKNVSPIWFDWDVTDFLIENADKNQDTQSDGNTNSTQNNNNQIKLPWWDWVSEDEQTLEFPDFGKTKTETEEFRTWWEDVKIEEEKKDLPDISFNPSDRKQIWAWTTAFGEWTEVDQNFPEIDWPVNLDTIKVNWEVESIDFQKYSKEFLNDFSKIINPKENFKANDITQKHPEESISFIKELNISSNIEANIRFENIEWWFNGFNQDKSEKDSENVESKWIKKSKNKDKSFNEVKNERIETQRNKQKLERASESINKTVQENKNNIKNKEDLSKLQALTKWINNAKNQLSIQQKEDIKNKNKESFLNTLENNLWFLPKDEKNTLKNTFENEINSQVGEDRKSQIKTVQKTQLFNNTIKKLNEVPRNADVLKNLDTVLHQDTEFDLATSPAEQDLDENRTVLDSIKWITDSFDKNFDEVYDEDKSIQEIQGWLEEKFRNDIEFRKNSNSLVATTQALGSQWSTEWLFDVVTWNFDSKSTLWKTKEVFDSLWDAWFSQTADLLRSWQWFFEQIFQSWQAPSFPDSTIAEWETRNLINDWFNQMWWAEETARFSVDNLFNIGSIISWMWVAFKAWWKGSLLKNVADEVKKWQALNVAINSVDDNEALWTDLWASWIIAVDMWIDAISWLFSPLNRVNKVVSNIVKTGRKFSDKPTNATSFSNKANAQDLNKTDELPWQETNSEALAAKQNEFQKNFGFKIANPEKNLVGTEEEISANIQNFFRNLHESDWSVDALSKQIENNIARKIPQVLDENVWQDEIWNVIDSFKSIKRIDDIRGEQLDEAKRVLNEWWDVVQNVGKAKETINNIAKGLDIETSKKIIKNSADSMKKAQVAETMIQEIEEIAVKKGWNITTDLRNSFLETLKTSNVWWKTIDEINVESMFNEFRQQLWRNLSWDNIEKSLKNIDKNKNKIKKMFWDFIRFNKLTDFSTISDYAKAVAKTTEDFSTHKWNITPDTVKKWIDNKSKTLDLWTSDNKIQNSTELIENNTASETLTNSIIKENLPDNVKFKWGISDLSSDEILNGSKAISDLSEDPWTAMDGLVDTYLRFQKQDKDEVLANLWLSWQMFNTLKQVANWELSIIKWQEMIWVFANDFMNLSIKSIDDTVKNNVISRIEKWIMDADWFLDQEKLKNLIWNNNFNKNQEFFGKFTRKALSDTEKKELLGKVFEDTMSNKLTKYIQNPREFEKNVQNVLKNKFEEKFHNVIDSIGRVVKSIGDILLWVGNNALLKKSGWSNSNLFSIDDVLEMFTMWITKWDARLFSSEWLTDEVNSAVINQEDYWLLWKLLLSNNIDDFSQLWEDIKSLPSQVSEIVNAIQKWQTNADISPVYFQSKWADMLFEAFKETDSKNYEKFVEIYRNSKKRIDFRNHTWLRRLNEWYDFENEQMDVNSMINAIEFSPTKISQGVYDVDKTWWKIQPAWVTLTKYLFSANPSTFKQVYWDTLNKLQQKLPEQAYKEVFDSLQWNYEKMAQQSFDDLWSAYNDIIDNVKVKLQNQNTWLTNTQIDDIIHPMIANPVDYMNYVNRVSNLWNDVIWSSDDIFDALTHRLLKREAWLKNLTTDAKNLLNRLDGKFGDVENNNFENMFTKNSSSTEDGINKFNYITKIYDNEFVNSLRNSWIDSINMSRNQFERFSYRNFAYFSEARNSATGESLRENWFNLIKNILDEDSDISQEFTDDIINRLSWIVWVKSDEDIQAIGDEVKQLFEWRKLTNRSIESMQNIVNWLVNVMKWSNTDDAIRNEIIDRALKRVDKFDAAVNDTIDWLVESADSFKKAYENWLENLEKNINKSIEENSKANHNFRDLSSEELDEVLSNNWFKNNDWTTDYNKAMNQIISGEPITRDLLLNREFIRWLNARLQDKPEFWWNTWRVPEIRVEDWKMIDMYNPNSDMQVFNKWFDWFLNSTINVNKLLAQADLQRPVFRLAKLKTNWNVRIDEMQTLGFFRDNQEAVKKMIEWFGGKVSDWITDKMLKWDIKNISINQFLSGNKATFKNMVNELWISKEEVDNVIKTIRSGDSTRNLTEKETQMFDFLKAFQSDINRFRWVNWIGRVDFNDIDFRADGDTLVEWAESLWSSLVGNYVFFTKQEIAAISKKFGEPNWKFLFSDIKQNLLFWALKDRKQGWASTAVNNMIQAVQVMNYWPFAAWKGGNQFFINQKRNLATLKAQWFSSDDLKELTDLIENRLNFDLKAWWGWELLEWAWQSMLQVSRFLENLNVLYQSDRATLRKTMEAGLSFALAPIKEVEWTAWVNRIINNWKAADDFMRELWLTIDDINKQKTVIDLIRTKFPDEADDMITKWQWHRNFYNNEFEQVLADTRTALGSMLALDNIRELSGINVTDNYRWFFGLMKWAIWTVWFYGRDLANEVSRNWAVWAMKSNTIKYMANEIATWFKTAYNTDKLLEWEVDHEKMILYSIAPMIAFWMAFGERAFKDFQAANQTSAINDSWLLWFVTQFTKNSFKSQIVDRAFLYPSIIGSEIVNATNTFNKLWIEEPSAAWEFALNWIGDSFWKELAGRFLTTNVKWRLFDTNTDGNFGEDLVHKMFQSREVTKQWDANKELVNQLYNGKTAIGRDQWLFQWLRKSFADFIFSSPYSSDIWFIESRVDEHVNENWYDELLSDTPNKWKVLNLIRQWDRQKAMEKLKNENPKLDKEKLLKMSDEELKDKMLKQIWPDDMFDSKMFDLILDWLEWEWPQITDNFSLFRDSIKKITNTEWYQEAKDNFYSQLKQKFEWQKEKSLEDLEEELQKFQVLTAEDWSWTDMAIAKLMKWQVDAVDKFLREKILWDRETWNILELSSQVLRDKVEWQVYNIYKKWVRNFQYNLINKHWDKIKDNKMVWTLLKNELLESDQELWRLPVKADISLTDTNSTLKALLFQENWRKIFEQENHRTSDETVQQFSVIWATLLNDISKMSEDTQEDIDKKTNAINYSLEKILWSNLEILKGKSMNSVDRANAKKWLAFAMLPVAKELKKFAPEWFNNFLTKISDAWKQVIDDLTDSLPVREDLAFSWATDIWEIWEWTSKWWWLWKVDFPWAERSKENYFKLLEAHNEFVDLAMDIKKFDTFDWLWSKIKYNRVGSWDNLDIKPVKIDVPETESEQDIETTESEIDEPEQSTSSRTEIKSSITEPTWGNSQSIRNSKGSSRQIKV